MTFTVTLTLQFLPQGPSVGMLVLICIFSISFGYGEEYSQHVLVCLLQQQQARALHEKAAYIVRGTFKGLDGLSLSVHKAEILP